MAAERDAGITASGTVEGRRLRVGAYEVDLDRRVVSRPDAEGSRRLTLKAVQVLLVLVEAEGRVVSREQLLAKVWPNTLPTDDVLTQAIAQLRRAFEDSREAPRYIETIAKGGYRLLAPCGRSTDGAGPAAAGPGPAPAAAGPVATQLPSTPTEAVAAVPPVRRRGWSAGLAAVLAAAVLLLGACAYLWQVRQVPVAAGVALPAPAPAVQYQAIAHTPLRERAPAVSPDGSLVVYSRPVQPGGPEALYLQPPGDAGARQLTFPGPGAGDHVPAWSRDGRRIAFVRTGGARGCVLMVVEASGGGEREIGPCEGGDYAPFDWTPDGRALVMGGRCRHSHEAAPLRRLDLASGRWGPLPYAADGIDTLPRHSPDGKWLGFLRGTSLGDLWLMPAGGGTPRQLTRLRGDIRGWDWLPDGSGVVFSLVKEEARLYHLRLADGTISELPPLARGNPIHPDIAAAAWSMAFEIDRFRSGMYRFDLERAGWDVPAEPVFASSGVDLLPTISPDGSRLAFVSDRSLSAQLWIGEVAHPQTLRAVPGIVPVPRHAPVWSPDGRRLLMVGATGRGGDRLYEVKVGFDTVRVLPVPGVPVFAAYTGEADQLLVGVDGGAGRMRLVRYRLPEWRELASLDDVAVARYDHHVDRVCFTRPARPGLWCADGALRRVEQISRVFPDPERYREWTIAGGRILTTLPDGDCATAWSELAGDGLRPLRCLSREHMVVAGSTSADDAAATVYLSLPLEQDVDIGWAPLAALAPAAASD